MDKVTSGVFSRDKVVFGPTYGGIFWWSLFFCKKAKESIADAYSAYCTDLRLADRVSFMMDSESILSNPWAASFPIPALQFFVGAASTYAGLSLEQLREAADFFLRPDSAEARGKITNAQLTDVLSFLEQCARFRDRPWWPAFFQQVVATRLGFSARWVRCKLMEGYFSDPSGLFYRVSMN